MRHWIVLRVRRQEHFRPAAWPPEHAAPPVWSTLHAVSVDVRPIYRVPQARWQVVPLDLLLAPWVLVAQEEQRLPQDALQASQWQRDVRQQALPPSGNFLKF